MSSGLALQTETDTPAIVACTVSRNVHRFDLLIEDMETELGDGWGDLGFEEARAFLGQPEADDLIFIALAITTEDEADVGMLGELIRTAKSRGTRVLIVADGVTPGTLHQLLKLGADDFLPYPLSDGALRDAVERVRKMAAEPPGGTPNSGAPVAKPVMEGQGAIFAVQNLGGGTGASTLAVNLGWELATIDKKKAPRVCVIDFDLQYGAAATYLDLPRREIVMDFLQDGESMDADAFRQALVAYGDKLFVFTAPPEIVPLDIMSATEVNAILNLAQQCFDIVIVDMPRSLVVWTEAVLNRSDIFFATLELDLRSAQNAMRFIKALRAEDLPLEKVQYVMNRAPGGMDLSGKARVKKLAESLGVAIKISLPDGGKAVQEAGDNGQPLAEAARKNPLRKEIAKLATGLHEAMTKDAVAAK